MLRDERDRRFTLSMTYEACASSSLCAGNREDGRERELQFLRAGGPPGYLPGTLPGYPDTRGLKMFPGEPRGVPKVLSRERDGDKKRLSFLLKIVAPFLLSFFLSPGCGYQSVSFFPLHRWSVRRTSRECAEPAESPGPDPGAWPGNRPPGVERPSDSTEPHGWYFGPGAVRRGLVRVCA